MTNLLVELQTEELPPKALRKLSEAFAEGVCKSLADAHFLADSSVTTAYGAPRRLAVHITDVLAKSPDETFRQKLVPVKVGIGADGQATPALVKKMAALGINCAVTDLERVDDGKNEQLYYEGVRQGVELASGLQHALEYAVKHLPIPKVMTYQLADGVTTVSFVRPVRHLTALLGTEIVPVELFGLKSGRLTRGHRFHTSEPIAIENADSYVEQMKAAFVMPCYDERRAVIEAELKRRAAALDAEAIMPEDLLEEVTALTEWPVIYESQFESEFLAVPQECLILTMQLNQKYFALEDRSGKLMNRFLSSLPKTAARPFPKAMPVWFVLVLRTRSSSMIRTACTRWKAVLRVCVMLFTTISSAASMSACFVFAALRRPQQPCLAPTRPKRIVLPCLPRPTSGP